MGRLKGRWNEDDSEGDGYGGIFDSHIWQEVYYLSISLPHTMSQGDIIAVCLSLVSSAIVRTIVDPVNKNANNLSTNVTVSRIIKN